VPRRTANLTKIESFGHDWLSNQYINKSGRPQTDLIRGSLGWYWLRLSSDQMQTLTFTMLVFAGQGNVYVLRERGRLWRSRPAPVMLLASGCDLLLVIVFATGGILMSPLPIWIVASLVVATVLFSLAMDSIKLAVFARIRID
jgi:H+-transporting ATPase